LEKNSIGLVLRAFTPPQATVEETHKAIDKNIGVLRGVVERAAALTYDGASIYSQVNIVVQNDPRYIDCDCGLTAQALRRVKQSWEVGGLAQRVLVQECLSGDLYVGNNNFALREQREAGLDYIQFLSPGLLDYFVWENMAQVLEALEKGARGVGVAMEPHRESILKQGFLLDTFDIFHIESLMSVGGYDVLAAQPTRLEKARKETSPLFSLLTDPETGEEEYVYAYAGVEEMVPIIRLVRKYGRCIAPIDPKVKGVWKIPAGEAAQKRERLKNLSKTDRQRRVCEVEGVPLDFVLTHGVMEDYRHDHVVT